MIERVLMCITVYNGQSFVPRALQSAQHISADGFDLDLLVLDDCSPDCGWSAQLNQLCDGLGINYYRTPRNLGIPRNFNMALATGVAGGYDYVLLCNSDVVFPLNLVKQMVRACRDETLGSVTAFSNNVSVFSLPNSNPERYLVAQEVVDWISGSLEGEFGHNVLDIPSGVGFCMIFPVRAIEVVGLMDPVFGRGYCEEIDWTLRSKAAGYRVGLAPGVFVYHEGGATNRRAGILVGNSTTVQSHEEIIDLRYPQYRYQLTAFESSQLLPKVHKTALRRIISTTGAQTGYTVDFGWLRLGAANRDDVSCLVAPGGLSEILLQYRGFEYRMKFGPAEDPLKMLADFFGRPPSNVRYDPVTGRSMNFTDLAHPTDDRLAYPSGM